MAVLTPGKKGQRFPSLRGRVEFHARKGKIVAQKWRRKRGRAQTPGQRDRQEWFRQANVLAKYADGRQQALSRCAMEHLPVRPFDALLAAMAGRLWAVEADDGRTLYSMAARGDVSKNLDVLNQEPGRILIRGPKFWEAFEWGSLNQYIASQGPDVPPIWKDLPPGVAELGETFKTTLSANQSIPSRVTTKIKFDLVAWDTEGDYDNVTNFRFTPTRPGKYQVTAQLRFGPLPNLTLVLTDIRKNGNLSAQGALKLFGATATGLAATTALVAMNGTTDFLEAHGWQNSGASALVDAAGSKTYFEAVWVFP